jgi:hypothetical protein
MSKTLEAIFDGEVLRPEDKSGLEPNTRYRITVERAEHTDAPAEAEYPLTALLELATDMGTPDLATRHDLFAHGKLE